MSANAPSQPPAERLTTKNTRLGPNARPRQSTATPRKRMASAAKAVANDKAFAVYAAPVKSVWRSGTVRELSSDGNASAPSSVVTKLAARTSQGERQLAGGLSP